MVVAVVLVVVVVLVVIVVLVVVVVVLVVVVLVVVVVACTHTSHRSIGNEVASDQDGRPPTTESYSDPPSGAPTADATSTSSASTLPSFHYAAFDATQAKHPASLKSHRNRQKSIRRRSLIDALCFNLISTLPIPK